jgi:RNA polymerase sigma factor (sigma-70 family)
MKMMVNGLQTGGLRPTSWLPGPSGEVEQTNQQLLERFTRLRDEAAFAALVRRYGPMVLGVCRRVLSHVQDAEDAFQATFLVLVRKAGTIARPELLGNWLYGVAYRIAKKAKAHAARRSTDERQAKSMTPADPVAEVAWREVRSRLDDALQRLPEKYRLPLVLCYLEGRTNEEAARQLGWPVGSMSARLARGRELLRERLADREQAVPAGLFALILGQHVGPTIVPPELVDTTVRAGLWLAQGQAAVSLISPSVIALAEETGSRFGRYWLWNALAVLLALVALGTSVLACTTLTGRSLGSSPPPLGSTGSGTGGQGQSSGCHDN